MLRDRGRTVFPLVAALTLVAATPSPSPPALVPGTYAQVSPETKKPLELGNQLVIIAGKSGRLGFSVNAVRALDDNQGFVAGVLGAGRPPVTWSQTATSGNCRLRFDLVPGGLKVTQDAAFGDCGFGYGVTADGTYALRTTKP
jgi:hypothetical protein